MLPVPESIFKFLHFSNSLEVNSNTSVSESWQDLFLRHLNKPNDFIKIEAIDGFDTLQQDGVKKTDIVPKISHPPITKE